MAKILKVIPGKTPDKIVVGSEPVVVRVHTEIEFHPLDLQLKMEYMLLLYAYDVRGRSDVQVLLNNWDESSISAIPQETEDDVLGKASSRIVAENKTLSLSLDLKLKMGLLDKDKYYERRNLRIFAELIPAIGQASKWSNILEIDLEH